MRIAQVSPLYESVPPKLYGGTERVVAYLTDALVELGHDVTLFASGDSQTKARLVPCSQQALRLDPNCLDAMALHMLLLQQVFDCANRFDIIHFHIDYLHFPFTENSDIPKVTTLHGRLNIKELELLYRRFDNQPVVSISYSQREPLPHADWVKNVYHGLPVNLHRAGGGNGGYLAFLGRISPEKRVDRAIQIAIKVKKPLKIAAKIDKVDQLYFEKEIRHLFDHPLVEYVGEIAEEEKSEFLGNAECLLFPIDWPEPFGMVMIEAMACGTPVIAFRNGSVPEVIDPGVTGYIVDSIEEACKCLESLHSISRTKVRKVFETKYSATRMAKDYLKLYSELIHGSKTNTFILPDINKRQLRISSK